MFGTQLGPHMRWRHASMGKNASGQAQVPEFESPATM